MPIKLPIVILSTADFDAEIWTNKQHIATRLAEYVPVTYIESLGLREPSLHWSDVRRIFTRLIRRVSPANVFLASKPGAAMSNRRAPTHVSVIAPIVLPWHKFSMVQRINRWLIEHFLIPKLPNQFILWTFSPITYGLDERATKVFYHSVDLLHTLPNIPGLTLLDHERRLIQKATRVIVSSEGVRQHMLELGAAPLLWENVADVELFKSIQPQNRVRRAIFVGNLTPSKVDFSILEQLAEQGIPLALAGPINIDGIASGDAVERLIKRTNVEYLGVLSQAEMAVELAKSWLGLIPYKVNDYTAGVFPMKVYEYLSSGLQVVATPIPSLALRAVPGVQIAKSTEFIAQAASICSADYCPPPGEFTQNSWNSRVKQIISLVDA